MRKTRNQLVIDLLTNKDNLHRLVIIEWFDPYDDSEEVTVDNLNAKKAVYETCGFLMGVSNGHVVMGYNKDMIEQGKYKGCGYTPLSLITNAHLMDRNS